MPQNRSSVDDLEEELDADKIDIPSRFPGGKGFRRPEILETDGTFKRPRGRPKGSTNKTSSSTPTSIQNDWTNLAAIGLGLSTTVMAMRVFRNPKYKMTKIEAESAAKAVVEVAFHYKEIRELATKVNTNSDMMIIARGFYPYLSRVMLGEILNNVMAGFFVPKQSTPPNNGAGTEQRSTGQFSGISSGFQPAATRQQFNGNNGPIPNVSGNGTPASTGLTTTIPEPDIPAINIADNWRDVG